MISCRERASNSNTESIFVKTKKNQVQPYWQYPVISLSLKSAKQGNYKNAFAMLRQAISQEFRRHESAVLDSGYEKERIRRLLNAQGDESDYLGSLQFLSQILYET